MIDDLNARNVVYEKRIGQRAQEQNELIITERQEIKEFARKPLNSVIELKGCPLTWPTFESKPPAPAVPINAPAQQTSDAQSSLTVAQGRENEQKLNDKIHLRKAFKNNPSLTKEIRTVLEQSLVEKLETLGINADVCDLPSDHLNRVLRIVESARPDRGRQVPNST